MRNGSPAAASARRAQPRSRRRTARRRPTTMGRRRYRRRRPTGPPRARRACGCDRSLHLPLRWYEGPGRRPRGRLACGPARRPCRADAPRRAPGPSLGRPSRRARCTCCSTMTTAAPVSSATWRTIGSSDSTTTGARPRLSSSMSSTFGRLHERPGQASICCSPPDRLPAATFQRGRAPGTGSTMSRAGRLAFAPGRLDVLGDGQRREQRSVVGHEHQPGLGGRRGPAARRAWPSTVTCPPAGAGSRRG